MTSLIMCGRSSRNNGLIITGVWILVFHFLVPISVSLDEVSRDSNQRSLENEMADVRSHDKVVVCYLGTWATYRSDAGGFDLLGNFDPMLCTHLIYAFAGLDNVTNGIRPLDPYLDLEADYGRGWYKKATTLKSRYPHLKVLIAIGGWNEGSVKYSKMVADQASRKVFVDSALAFVLEYNFDGLDLDWEFPADRGGKPEDKPFFTTLIRELRTRFDPHGLLLTAAFSASDSKADSAYELSEVSRLLDQVHIMCYDYHGTWDKRTDHNAPLHASPGSFSVEHSVDHFLKNGVPPSKLVLGVPFYGRTLILTKGEELGDGLYQEAHSEGFAGPFTKEKGFMGYNEICLELDRNRPYWETYWDEIAKVPYLRNGNKWISYDNSTSIQDKVDFAMSRGLKGIMVWSIDTDDFVGACGEIKYPLLRAIHVALKRSRPSKTKDLPGSGALRLTSLAIFIVSSLLMSNLSS